MKYAFLREKIKGELGVSELEALARRKIGDKLASVHLSTETTPSVIILKAREQLSDRQIRLLKKAFAEKKGRKSVYPLRTNF